MKTDKEIKAVGQTGQRYYNRKTNKTAVLESCDDKYKTVMMVDDDGKSFSISYSTFRNTWRIVDESEKAEEVVKEVEKEISAKVSEVVNEVVEQTQEEPIELKSIDDVFTDNDYVILKNNKPYCVMLDREDGTFTVSLAKNNKILKDFTPLKEVSANGTTMYLFDIKDYYDIKETVRNATVASK